MIKYFRISNYIKYAVSLINSWCLHYLDIYFAPPAHQKFKYSPIFIIGAPRSGSTLLFQLLTDGYNFAYFSNIHCRLFGSPSLIEKFLKPMDRLTPSNYTSEFGKTNGRYEPSECGEWWYRFFQRKRPNESITEPNDKKMKQFRRSLLYFTNTTARPVICKNLYATLRLEEISEYIPEALFVVVTRNEEDNCRSILNARLNFLGSHERWWSIETPDSNYLKTLPPKDQAISQIRGINKIIMDSVRDGIIAKEKIIEINYDSFRKNTRGLIGKFDRFLKSNGVPIDKRFDLPNSL